MDFVPIPVPEPMPEPMLEPMLEPISDKVPDTVKTNALEQCLKCGKSFKSSKTLLKHTKIQSCYKPFEITYCNICGINLVSHNDYCSHLMTMEHIEKIGCNKLEKLIENKTPSILAMDPFLSTSEAKIIGTTNLGSKLTFTYEDNKMQVVKLIRQPEPIHTNNISEQSQNNITTNITSNTSEQPAPDKIIKPTPRQVKLLKFLETQKTLEQANNALLKMIDNIMEIDDYYGLTTFIKEDVNIIPDIKKVYLTVIEKFVVQLTKKRSVGEITYKGKDITKLVVLLTM